MDSFEHNNVKYTLKERTYHREKEGGYEKWMFEIGNKKYYFDGDIRYLPETNDMALYVDFYSQASLDTGAPFVPTNEEGYSALLILNSLAELIVKRLPRFRYYDYLVFPCSPEWSKAITLLIQKYGTLVTDKNIIKEIENYLNYQLTVLIDSNYYTCYVGRLS